MTQSQPILMSGAMVRAILEGRKSQTRRIIKPQPIPASKADALFRSGPLEADDLIYPMRGAGRYLVSNRTPPHPEWVEDWVKYRPGQLLWVRESLECANGEAIGYPADGSWLPNTPWRWKRAKLPSIHMPRWASRLTLEVTAVKVERLQDISAEDAEAEGCPPCPRCKDVGWINEGPDGGYECSEPGCGDPHTDQFRRLWTSINGPGSWEANPWVVAVSFTPHLKNIDQLETRKDAQR